MRARAAFLAGAGSAAILAVGWNVGAQAMSVQTATTTPATSSDSTNTSTSGSSTSNSTSTDQSSSAASSPSASPTTSGPADGTYSGQAVGYRYGTVQVNVVVSGGSISDVQLVQASATKGRDQAFPVLVSETLTAQSANISNLSGATFTTQAYQQALQSALDAAGWQG